MAFSKGCPYIKDVFKKSDMAFGKLKKKHQLYQPNSLFYSRCIYLLDLRSIFNEAPIQRIFSSFVFGFNLMKGL